MKLAFCLSFYFPYGGLQRDFMRIADLCQKRGHEVHVYTTFWEGDIPPWVTLHKLEITTNSNHTLIAKFAEQALADIARQNFDGVIGFIRMPGLDVYYAADSCFVAKPQYLRFPCLKWTARYQQYAQFEAAVFDVSAHTHILAISSIEKEKYQQYYQTPEARFSLLAPGVDTDRKPDEHLLATRQTMRQSLGIDDDALVLLSIGSSYRIKGIDRSLRAFSALSVEKRRACCFLIVGHEKYERRYQRLAKQLGVDKHVRFLGVRYDIPQLLFCADLLVHAARIENTGTAIAEALVAHTPVLVTDNCGYAHFVRDADAGFCIPSPFKQQRMNALLDKILDKPLLERFARQAKKYCGQHDLHGLIEQAVLRIEAIAQDKHV